MKAHCERPHRLSGVELRGMAHDAGPIEAPAPAPPGRPVPGIVVELLTFAAE